MFLQAVILMVLVLFLRFPPLFSSIHIGLIRVVVILIALLIFISFQYLVFFFFFLSLYFGSNFLISSFNFLIFRFSFVFFLLFFLTPGLTVFCWLGLRVVQRLPERAYSCSFRGIWSSFFLVSQKGEEKKKKKKKKKKNKRQTQKTFWSSKTKQGQFSAVYRVLSFFLPKPFLQILLFLACCAFSFAFSSCCF